MSLDYCTERWWRWTVEHIVQHGRPLLQWSRLIVSKTARLLDLLRALYVPLVIIMHHHDAKTAEVRCDDSPWWPWSCAFFHSRLILSGDPLPMIQELRGRPGALRQRASGWYPDLTAITCFRIWCAGVVAPNLATCPNSMWRLLIIVLVMFGRPVWTATSEFLTWSFHVTPRIWRRQLKWKDWSLRLSSCNAPPYVVDRRWWWWCYCA